MINNIPSGDFYGYKIDDIGNVTLSGNTANYEIASNKTKIGIHAQGCDLLTIKSITFTGGANATNSAMGLYIWNTTNSLLCCNTNIAQDVGTGYFLANNATRYRGTINTGPFNEYALDFVNTMTGIKQIYPGNDWAGVSAIDDARFFLGDPNEAINNFFLVSTLGLPFHPNDGIDGPGQWFQTILSNELSCTQDPDCNGVPGVNCDDYPNDQLLLVDGYSGLHGEGLTWQARKHVLKDYWSDPNFGCNNSMSLTFKSNFMSTSLGKLAKLSNDIDSLFQISTTSRQDLDNFSNVIDSEMQAIQAIDLLWNDPN
jgi:hypothetical protein